jgi:hypothetical protein
MALPPPPGRAQYPAPLHQDPVINGLYQAHPEIIPQQQQEQLNALENLMNYNGQANGQYQPVAQPPANNYGPPADDIYGELVDDIYGKGNRRPTIKYRRIRTIRNSKGRQRRKSNRKSKKPRRVKRY